MPGESEQNEERRGGGGGRTGEEALAVNLADDLGAEHLAVGADEAVDLLDDVEEDLVLAVLDAGGTPRVLGGDVLGDVDLGLVQLLSLWERVRKTGGKMRRKEREGEANPG